MDYETRHQLGELDELRDAHKSRLLELELRAAKAGISTPPEVANEISEIKVKLVPIDAAIYKLTYVGTVRADVPANQRGGDNVGYAVERTLERERRAMVSNARDAETLNEVRLATAMEAMRHTVYIIGGLALAALILAVALIGYIVAKGGL